MNEQNGTEKLSGEGKLLKMLLNWKDRAVPLAFHLRGGEVLEATLLYWTKFEYIVQRGPEQPAILLPKHTIGWIERG